MAMMTEMLVRQQCAKMLSDTSVIKFYPSKFVLITELLDTFGRLVFERLRGRYVLRLPLRGCCIARVVLTLGMLLLQSRTHTHTHTHTARYSTTRSAACRAHCRRTSRPRM